MDGRLTLISKSANTSLYKVSTASSTDRIKKFIVSTPETRSICNDPFLIGIRYTQDLCNACANTLKELAAHNLFTGTENTTTVFHILRGGLNFGLRESLANAFGWNNHSSAFVSAQRARKSDNPEDWFITESSYKKVHFRPANTIVFGDVVATGTSLEYALKQIREIATEQKVEISSILFFTIGGPRSHELLEEIDAECRKRFKSYTGASVVYFEGIFAVAEKATKMEIKIDGTDLIRTNSLLAPEFIESQYEDPSFPIERCTIYDAGSRSFDIQEFIEDVEDYWSQTLKLAEKGVTYKSLLKERFPEISSEKFDCVELESICKEQISKCHAILEQNGRVAPLGILR